MVLALLGSVGLGFMWGWLAGARAAWAHLSLRAGLALAGGSLLLALPAYLMADWRASALFLGAAALAFVFHHQWRRELRQRFGPPNH